MDKVELISTESFYLDLNINGKSYFRTSQYALREKLYGRALDRLDREIEKVANLNRNEELGGFLWCYTFDLHRVDGVAGTVLYYYLFEILLELKKERGDFRLIVRKSLPRFVIEVINHQLKIKTQDKVNVVDKLKLFLRYRFGPLKRFLRNKKMVTETESNPSKIEEGATIILYNIKSDLTRLKSFPDYLTEKRSKVYIVDHSLKYFKKHKASSVFRFENSNSGNVFKWLKKAYAVKSLIKSTHHKLQNEVYFTSVMKQQSLLQTAYML